MDLQASALTGVVFFCVLTLIFGVLIGRIKGKPSLTNQLLADRKLGFIVGIFTLTATWVGGGYLNGTVESVYKNGLAWTQAPWCYALSLLIGGIFFAKIMRQRNYTTMLDPFAERYGKEVAAILYIPALIGEIFWSAAILVALGATGSLVLGIHYSSAVVLSTLFAIFYAYIGGLWTVAYTDVLQLIFIVVGLSLVLPFVMEGTGGVETLITQYQAKFGDFSGFFPPMDVNAWGWLDMALLLIFGGIPWGVYFQRILATRTPEDAKNLSIWAGIFCFLLALPCIAIGAVAAVTDWSATGAPAAPEGTMALPYVLKYLTPPAIAVIGLGVVAAGVIASVDASILSVSSMFVFNIYKPLFRSASEQHLLKAMRGSIWAAGLLAMWLALTVKSVYVLWYLCSDLVYVILFPQLVLVLYGKNITKQGVLCGIAVGLILRIAGGEPALGIPALIEYGALPFRTMAMLASLLTVLVVSKVTQPAPEEVLATEEA